MLTTLAYVRYARRPSVGRYLVVVVPFALGLLAKPMLVTLPITLLLLDVWPLARRDRGLGRLVAEKLPLLALSLAVSAVTHLDAARCRRRSRARDTLPRRPHRDRARQLRSLPREARLAREPRRLLSARARRRRARGVAPRFCWRS